MKSKIIKVASNIIEQQEVYGPPSENVYGNNTIESTIQQQELYGPPPVKGNAVAKGSNIAIVIVLFVLGIVALVNKKMSKTSKAIIVISLILIAILITALLNYFF